MPGPERSGTPAPRVTLLSGDANPILTRLIGLELGIDPGEAEISTYADGEIRTRIAADVRGRVVVIVQPTCPPVSEHLVSLGFLVDAAVAAGARTVVAVVPYFGYSRQERRAAEGRARSAQVAARFLGMVGVHHLILLDLHEPALESAFPMSATLLKPDAMFLPVVRRWKEGAMTIVAPDAGGTKRAQRFAHALGAGMAVIAKERDRPDAAGTRQVLGDVRGRRCLIVDDLASTGRTLTGAARSLIDAGAAGVDAVFTHAVMTDDALERLMAAPLERMVTSDTIPVSDAARQVMEIVPAAPLLAEAVRRVAGPLGK